MKSCSPQKSPWSSRQCVGLLKEKPEFEPQARHQNKIRKLFIRRFPPSRFLAKTLRVNKIAMNSFLKNLSFGVDCKMQVPPLTYKHKWCKQQGRPKGCNAQLCTSMYVQSFIFQAVKNLSFGVIYYSRHLGIHACNSK